MKKIRYGVIGIKGIGQYHLRFAQQHEQVVLTAVVDIDAALVQQKSAELGVRGFTDYREMLEAGIVDAVSIATPHYLHGIIGLACLQAGLHVFIEKPFAIRLSEADAMLAEANARQLKICVGYQYRTYRTPQAMKRLIDSGALGNILRVLWTWSEFRPERYYERDSWRATWQHAGGGVLMNQVSHDLDLIGWLVGQPVEVSALLGNQLHQAEIEDIVCANIQFANGAFGSFQATTNQPRGYSVRQIAGDKGILVIQDVQSLTKNVKDQILLGTYEAALPSMCASLTGHHDQPKTVWQSQGSPSQKARLKKWLRKLPDHQWLRFPKSLYAALYATIKRAGWLAKGQPSGHVALMNSFIDAILNDEEPLVSGESARQTVELINAIILSAMRHKTVRLPLDPEEYDDLFEALSRGKKKVSRFR